MLMVNEALEWLADLAGPGCVPVVGGCLGFVVLAGVLGRRQRGRASAGCLSRFRRAAVALAGGLVVGGASFALDQRMQARPSEVSQMGEARAAAPPRPMPPWPKPVVAEGKPARDFTLPEARTGREVRFSRYRGRRPAVLIFGGFG
jgi:hypothetical protein